MEWSLLSINICTADRNVRNYVRGYILFGCFNGKHFQRVSLAKHFTISSHAAEHATDHNGLPRTDNHLPRTTFSDLARGLSRQSISTQASFALQQRTTRDPSIGKKSQWRPTAPRPR